MNGPFSANNPVGTGPGANYLGHDAETGERDCCRFRVWAPSHRRVEIHLPGSSREGRPDRLVAMIASDDGWHDVVIADVLPGSHYWYRLSTGVDRPDPASRLQPLGPHGPSAVVDLPFEWTDQAWKGLPLSDYIFYELHVGTFTPEGTFDAAISRLDDLVALGVTAVELMPIAQFPGHRNWGYDGTYLFAAQSSYGGPHGLARLVDACHRRGLAVVLDVVYNHLGPEGNYLADFAPYFSDRYRNDWGSGFNFDGPFSDVVRQYVIGNALYWFRDLHIDALRLDAVNYMFDGRPTHILEELCETVDRERPGGNRPTFVIAELLMNDPRYCRSRSRHGFGMDAQWCDDFHHALHALVTPERFGYYRDFGSLEALARAYRQGYHFVGQHSEYRQRGHGRPPEGVRADKIISYAQNHDQTGNRFAGDRLCHQIGPEAQKLVAAANVLAPHLPMLFMGEEYAESQPFPFFVSHGDPALIEAVRHGRKHEFAGLGWSSEPPDPQDEATFRRAKLRWDRKDAGWGASLRTFYQELIRLRKCCPSIRRPDFANVTVDVREEDRTLLLFRATSEEQTCLVLHFSAEAKKVALTKLAGWRTLIDSADARWAGPGGVGDGVLNDRAIMLKPWHAVLVRANS